MTHQRQFYACHGPQTDKIKNSNSCRRKDVLDIRIVPGHPDQPWIECYNNAYDDEDAKAGTAEFNAKIETLRLKHHLVKKEEKLKLFQEEVKRRVLHVQKLKKKQEERKLLERNECEQNLVLQRTGINVPYKGTAEDLEALNKQLLKSCIIPCNNEKQLQQNEVAMSNQKVDEIAKETKKENQEARLKLLSRKLDTFESCFPGGNWVSPSHSQIFKDRNSIHCHLKSPLLNWPLSDTWVGKDEINCSENKICSKREVSNLTLQNNFLEQKGEFSELHDFDFLSNDIFHTYVDCGADTEHERMQKKKQYWKYRKIFMDIERDQVRENKKLEDHRKQVEKLKFAKEQERERIEKQMTELVTQAIHHEEEPNDQSLDRLNLKVNQDNQKQESELYRYMEALRKVAKERIKFCNIEIPPLCLCGPTFLDSHPDKCANNCIFYKNIKAYVHSLTSVLTNTR